MAGFSPCGVSPAPTFCLVLSAPPRSESLVKGAPVVGSAFGFVASHAHRCSGLGPWGPRAASGGPGSGAPGGPSPARTPCQTAGPWAHADARLPPRLSHAWAVLTVAVELKKKPKL